MGSLLAAGAAGFALAQDVPVAPPIDVQDPGAQAQIDALNQTIDQRKTVLDDLNQQIDLYKRQISQKEAEQESLQNEMDLLSARIAQTNLDIQAAQAETDQVNAQVKILDAQIADVADQLERQRGLITVLLQKIDATDHQLTLQNLLTSDSFSELFDRLQAFENVNQDLLSAVKRAELAKDQIVQAKAAQLTKRDRLTQLAVDLAHSQAVLQDESGSKQQLIADSQSSESRFQSLLSSLKREQTQTQSDLQALQDNLGRKLRQTNPSATSQLAWPVDEHYKGLSTLFHDPTYPFRNLFEHTGVDIPEPQGTDVHAAGAGYVAWVRTGQLYGNYVMIVHPDGIATLYAHLSKPLVRQDQYVNQGDLIARSGGAAGEPGSGFSTGPHLHFEVRKDGIPVNPLDYLPSWQ